MVSFPPCKINLGLRIINKRPDGFHNIETCFFPVLWTDILEVIKADSFSFSCSGNSIPGTIEDNLCVKAYRLLETRYNLTPVKIHLHKIIPSGAGLGGGSSNAAHTLRLLNQVFQLNIEQGRLMEYATQLGSDCAFFVQDNAMLGGGRGDQLSPISLETVPNYMVLVNPGIHVSTADAFARVRPGEETTPIAKLITGDITSWRESLVNDFESSVFEKYPAIATIKKELYSLGAVYASMTGSGSTVFGIFNERLDLVEKFENAMVWVSWK